MKSYVYYFRTKPGSVIQSISYSYGLRLNSMHISRRNEETGNQSTAAISSCKGPRRRQG
ncbi:MAG: hypothetical protein ACE14P_04055 [Methanotrichaceae archaeon]